MSESRSKSRQAIFDKIINFSSFSIILGILVNITSDFYIVSLCVIVFLIIVILLCFLAKRLLKDYWKPLIEKPPYSDCCQHKNSKIRIKLSTNVFRMVNLRYYTLISSILVVILGFTLSSNAYLIFSIGVIAGFFIFFFLIKRKRELKNVQMTSTLKDSKISILPMLLYDPEIEVAAYVLVRNWLVKVVHYVNPFDLKLDSVERLDRDSGPITGIYERSDAFSKKERFDLVFAKQKFNYRIEFFDFGKKSNKKVDFSIMLFSIEKFAFLCLLIPSDSDFYRDDLIRTTIPVVPGDIFAALVDASHSERGGYNPFLINDLWVKLADTDEFISSISNSLYKMRDSWFQIIGKVTKVLKTVEYWAFIHKVILTFFNDALIDCDEIISDIEHFKKLLFMQLLELKEKSISHFIIFIEYVKNLEEIISNYIQLYVQLYNFVEIQDPILRFRFTYYIEVFEGLIAEIREIQEMLHSGSFIPKLNQEQPIVERVKLYSKLLEYLYTNSFIKQSVEKLKMNRLNDELSRAFNNKRHFCEIMIFNCSVLIRRNFPEDSVNLQRMINDFTESGNSESFKIVLPNHRELIDRCKEKLETVLKEKELVLKERE